MKLSDHIGVAALLEQTAEECTELAHACLKLARKVRDENPTPASEDDILANVTEESADVTLCIETLVETGILSYEGIDSVIMKKKVRWEDRINKNKL